MRVVLDTNVLLAALISPYGPPETIYRAWLARRFLLVASTTQLDEIRRASRYPKLKAILPPHRAGTLVNQMQRAVVLQDLPALPEGMATDDPDDAFLLAMALAGEAEFLVTGDRRAGVLERGSVGRARILLPAAFCAQVL